MDRQFSVMSTIVMAFMLLIPFIFSINAIDLESAKERSCFTINEIAAVDLKWVDSQSTWYYPVMSRLDLYYTSMAISEKIPSELQEDEVYYDSCIRTEMVDHTLGHSVGFGEKRARFTFTPVIDNEGHAGGHYVTDSGINGTLYFTLTDNSTFIFAAVCMHDNQMAWGVSSVLKVLPQETVKLIHDHAESLGFDREYFTGIRYDSCPPEPSKVAVQEQGTRPAGSWRGGGVGHPKFWSSKGTRTMQSPRQSYYHNRRFYPNI